MFSKFGLQALFLSALVFVLGCGVKTGEKNPTPTPAKVQSASCLKQAISDLKVFFKGDASDTQAESSLSCLEEVFVAFEENIRGEQKNVYTPREIATFVEINFLTPDDPKFSDTFLTELMFFKKALFGGDEIVITKSEIDLIVSFIARFKPDIVGLNPYMKIITLNWNQDRAIWNDSTQEAQFLAAKAQFQKVISKLTAEFAEGGRAYSIDHLINFAVEILKFARSEQTTIDTIQKAGPFLKKFKDELIGGDSSLKGDEWKKLGMTLHEAYFQALRFEYFLKNLDQNQIEKKWSLYGKITSDLTGLAKNLLQTKASRSLTNSEILELLKPLKEIIPQVGDINEQILNEIGEIKLLILGDSPIGSRGWSDNDFDILQKKIPVLFETAGTLFKAFDLFSSKESKQRPHLSYAEFSATEVQVLNAFYNLGQLVEKSYDLQSLHDLILNLSQGLLKNSFTLPDHFEALFTAAVSAKEFLTAEPSSSTSVASLRLLLNVGARAYLNYSEYDLFMSEFDMNSVEFISGLERLWPKLKTTLVTELNLRPGHVIATPDWVHLILVLQQQKILGTPLTEKSLTSAFDALWSNILNRPEDRLNSISRPGFDVVAIDQIAPEIESALGLQHHLAAVFSTSGQWSKDLISVELQKHVDSESHPSVKKALADITGFTLEAIPLTLNDDGMLKVLDPSVAEYHETDLTFSNLARFISRLLIRSYATDPARIADFSAATEDELQVAYSQLKPLAVDFDVVDPSNDKFVKSRFLEANLFLSVSDGDKFASFGELHHLIIHIISGITRAAEIKKDIVKNCVQPDQNGNKVVKGNTKVLESCLLDQYAVHEKGFAGMPQFLGMRTQYSADELREYNLNLLKAAGHVPKDDKTVYLSDADLFPHVVQYIEMVYARHDTNHDNLLQKEEAQAAFPIFKSLLSDLVKSYKQIKEEDLEGVFIYILKYGRPPHPQSIGEVLRFVAFIKDKTQKDWAISSTRLDLGKIFNFIADATVNNPTPKPPAAIPSPSQ